ncbi:PTS glucose transporter subunit IIA [uncultured Corynebacterium sp.]|uniref:PTS sugar transporter subunit IIA n=1 Tax=uncultured Corynebacterium sp. TaxID=159447 RepID=UPI0025D07BF4|nr:PTS glucose transporter subunit IIA [uncultured Corynebacterium sp.]
MTAVIAPITGTVAALSEVPDDVFAAGMVGAGVAVVPRGEGTVPVAAPVAGKILRIMPHAMVIITPENRGVLTHVGIGTVHMKGEGFTVHAAKGDRVEAGDVVITADMTAVRAAGHDPACPVLVMESRAEDIADVAEIGAEVSIGDPLFRI